MGDRPAGRIKVRIDLDLVVDDDCPGISPDFERVAWALAVERGLGVERLKALGVHEVVPVTRKLSLVMARRST